MLLILHLLVTCAPDARDSTPARGPGSDAPDSGDSGAAASDTADTADTGGCPGPAAPSIVVDPERIAFGEVALGTSADAELLITNEGNENLSLADITLEIGIDDGSTLRLGAVGAILLPPCTATTLALQFTPEGPGEVAASLLISSNDPDQGTLEVPIVGVGLGPEIAVTPLEIDFGTVCIGCGTSEPIEIQNVGNADLTLASVTVVTASGDLDLDLMEADNGALPSTLAPGDSRSMVLSYTPSDTYYDEAWVLIESDDPREPQVQVTVTGNGG